MCLTPLPLHTEPVKGLRFHADGISAVPALSGLPLLCMDRHAALGKLSNTGAVGVHGWRDKESSMWTICHRGGRAMTGSPVPYGVSCPQREDG